MKKFYLTTPIYYVNDSPHIGHAYTTIAADVLARWKRLDGHQVFFLTGTDEHGQKILEAAEKTQETPIDYATRFSLQFQKTWLNLGISNDDFIRTTEKRHETVVQSVFEKLKTAGDIYKGTYEDWYCLNDESYFSESELVNHKCPSCGRDVQKLKEESYFFKLSKYEKPLLKFYEENPGFLSPGHRASEILNFVKSGLHDLSVSRSRVKWGIPILSDPSHTIYVWFDALLNYITAIHYRTDQPLTQSPFGETWPCDVHFVGKEIFRFHTIIWPAILMALGIPLPTKVFAHGWWTVDGTKMSKSLGNVVDPNKMATEYGVDAFRYFILREVPFGSDGDFSEKALFGRYNAELANNLGNLLQRTATILIKNFDGKIPVMNDTSTLLTDLPDLIQALDSAYDRVAFGEVLEKLFGLMVRTNKFIDDKSPWKLGPDKREELSIILVDCLRVLKVLAVCYTPFMPSKMQELWNRLGEKQTLSSSASQLLAKWKKGEQPSFAVDQTLVKGDPLFMRKSLPPK